MHLKVEDESVSNLITIIKQILVKFAFNKKSTLLDFDY